LFDTDPLSRPDTYWKGSSNISFFAQGNETTEYLKTIQLNLDNFNDASSRQMLECLEVRGWNRAKEDQNLELGKERMLGIGIGIGQCQNL
jgi:hypothetical protein